MAPATSTIICQDKPSQAFYFASGGTDGTRQSGRPLRLSAFIDAERNRRALSGWLGRLADALTPIALFECDRAFKLEGR